MEASLQGNQIKQMCVTQERLYYHLTMYKPGVGKAHGEALWFSSAYLSHQPSVPLSFVLSCLLTFFPQSEQQGVMTRH